MCRSARRSCGGAEKAKSKTSVARDVILNSPAAGAMQRQRKRSQIAGQHGRLDPRYSIPWREERALRRSYWEPCLKRLGIRYRPPNNMRHSYATMMLMAGMPPAFCAKQLDHSVEMFLRTYSKWLNGASKTNTRLPVTFDWIKEDEVFAKAFCRTLIMTKPGIKNAV